MKKSLVMFVSLFLVLSVASLALGATTTTTPTAKPPKASYFKGTVDSVTLADPAKGTKSEIVVMGTAKAKTKMTFLVTDTTTIYAGKDKMTLDKIQPKQNVSVKYTTTKEGIKEALSIKVLKK
jgi:hypothetical protein